MEQSSIPTEAHSVSEQVNAEYDMQSDSVFRHNSDSTATESPGAYLLECSEELEQ